MEWRIRKKYGKLEEIHTIEEWKNTFFSGNDKRWKDGKSAKCLAEYIFNDYPKIPSMLKNEIAQDIGFYPVYSYPEHSTSFFSEGFGKGGPGGGRNHDLMIETSTRLITIEAKTDESYDRYMDEYVTDTPNKEARYLKTYKALFGEESLDHGIRYQLVQAVVATIIEAKKRSKNEAEMIVFTFKKSGYKYNHSALERNDKDYKYFERKLKGSNNFLKFCEKYGVDVFNIKHFTIEL